MCISWSLLSFARFTSSLLYDTEGEMSSSGFDGLTSVCYIYEVLERPILTYLLPIYLPIVIEIYSAPLHRRKDRSELMKYFTVKTVFYCTATAT